ncbi:carbohydrate kinase family protein [Primorskyibacter marinus]|uniref:carbohydrate kinase family protein n=1 Tax=Primorskyibacter marinus TaxID=1977320 RepID=UPI000E30A50B|nr:PfkB family carbohydrate kinase [Primorskyibacter marinus]
MSLEGAVICAGRLYCDLIFTGVPRLPSLGTEIYAAGLGLHAGGGAFITAAHFGALGRRAALAATLPGAPFDTIVSGDLAHAGLDLSLCRAAPDGNDPQITVVLTGAEDRAFVTRRSGPALPRLTAGDLRGGRHLHIGELATLVECPWLIDAARDAGLTLSLDCAWDETLDAKGAVPLIAQVDVFLPNAVEAQRLVAAGLPPPWSNLDVIKRGAEGATAGHGDTEIAAPAIAVTPVDTTGAGDAFNAGFLNAWLDGAGTEASLRLGNDRAARAISGRGGFNPAETVAVT